MAGYSNALTAGVKNGNGKRERIEQEDDQEFMPLSKRINNIHLSPERLVNGVGSGMYMHNNNGVSIPSGHPALANGVNGIPESQLPNGYHNNHQLNGFRGGFPEVAVNFNESGVHAHSSSSSSSSPEHALSYHQNLSSSEVPAMSIHSPEGSSHCPDYQYRPSLSQNANPHYYEANRTLFELYIERQLRTHQIPHPHVYGTESVSSVD